MRSCRQIIVVCLAFDERISLNKKVTLISQGYKPFKFENAGFYSHSIVAGGFPLISYTTREMPFTSLMIRLDTLPNKS